MKLNHLDLDISNVPQARDFFVKYFDFICLTDNSDKMSILQGSDGFVLVSTKIKSSNASNTATQFHIGFILDEVIEVEEKYQQLKDSGIELPLSLIKNKRGTMFYFNAPGGILVEVSCRQ